MKIEKITARFFEPVVSAPTPSEEKVEPVSGSIQIKKTRQEKEKLMSKTLSNCTHDFFYQKKAWLKYYKKLLPDYSDKTLSWIYEELREQHFQDQLRRIRREFNALQRGEN